MFKYIFIPSDVSKEIEQRSESKEGGLENDALRRGAEDFFQEAQEAIDYDAERRSTADALIQQGVEPEKISEIMQTIGGKRIGSNVEIITVSVATDANKFIGVSMYSDGHIGFKQNPSINKRATKLLRNCGHDVDVKGDVFIGRAFDDEREEWVRNDFIIEDLDDNAPWISSTKAANAGRNMGAYRTSGAMKKMIQPGDVASLNADEEQIMQATEAANNGYLSWNQTSDEVEVRFALPSECSAKLITVTISSSALKVSNKSGEQITGVGSRFHSSDGAPFFGKVISSDSMWSISTEDGVKVLCVTLTKIDSKNWQRLLL